MSDWKKLIERVDQLALEVVLTDLSSADASGKQFIETLSSLCASLKSALTCLDRGEDPSEYIKALGLKPKTYFDSHAGEISGFVGPAKGLLDEAQRCLSALKKSPDDKVSIDGAFRVFHTLKGEANLTGLASIATLSNEAEDFLGALRTGTIKADTQSLTALLKAVDQLRGLLDAISADPQKASKEDVTVFVSQLQGARAGKSSVAAPTLDFVFKPQPPELDILNGPDIYVDFATEAFDHLAGAEKSILVLEQAPDDKGAIDSIFRAFHSIKGAARFLDLKDIQLYAHETEAMLDSVRKGTLRFEGLVVKLSLSSIDGIRRLLTLLQEQVANNGRIKGEYLDIGGRIAALKEVMAGKKNQPIGEILINQGVITDQELNQALKIQKERTPDARLGDILVVTKAASSKQVEEALKSQNSGSLVGISIRVQLEKLDNLIDMVGELVISETMVVQNPDILAIKAQNLNRNLAEFDRITRNLQHTVMSMRLVPIAPVFQKMERIVHDLSREIGKDVKVFFSGEDTEVDKNIAELVVDPLMHMVRNSIDHGMEPKDVRAARGKPPVGRIELSAFHKGGNVVVEVKDDGCGLNKDKILKKAIERGIVKEDENLSDHQIFNLIFEAGFSTAEKVTEVSGRGVGLDIVRKNVDKLQGKISVSSVEGKGSVFSLFLPITLAIVDGIIVRTGHERYVLPIHSVIEFVQPKEADRSLVYDKEQMYKVYGKVYPLIHLNEVFGIPAGEEKFEKKTICILGSDDAKACVVVDELLGQQQVVIKTLGKKFKEVRGVSGAAILGDGRVGLILDVEGLISFAVKQAVN